MYQPLSDSAFRAAVMPDQRMSASTRDSPRALNCRRICDLPDWKASAASSACRMQAMPFSLRASASAHASFSAAFENFNTSFLPHRWPTRSQTAQVLLLIDLDNTLIDRSLAFKTW